MDFVLATNNMKKLAEMQRILAPLGVNIVTAKSLGTELPEVEETGVTFAENAELKAQSACDITGLPAIADDSGLCVDYLNGAPGVYSARFAGEHGNDEKIMICCLRSLRACPKASARHIMPALFAAFFRMVKKSRLRANASAKSALKETEMRASAMIRSL